MTTHSRPRRRHLASSPFKPRVEAPIEEYAIDDRVCHDTYGMGRVIGLEPHAVSVDFGDQKVRVTSPFSNMEKF